ncbi:hypothetical protein IT397_00020, partial [Candidatus Nomurabacteria bacterium]|nr:hypothetical protein [Candidatus Nomurabacteria bacterium]
DAHAILHRAYHALPDFLSSKGEPTGGLYGLSSMLIKIIADLKPDYIVACYDLPSPTHRHEVYKEYKAGRKKADDELVAQMIRSRDVFTAFNIPIYDKPGFEADDILGTIVEKLKGEKDTEVVIASGDMDTLQLVSGEKVKVYTLKKGINDTVIYDEKAVKERFGFGPELLPDYKGLRGDPSDNIVGIDGIGEKTGSTLIQKFGSIENIYKILKKDKAKLEKEGIKERIIKLLEDGEEEAGFSKMLATIRRDAPIDFKVPEHKWIDGVEVNKIEDIFKILEFRTLGERFKQTLSSLGKDMPKTSSDEVQIEKKLEKVNQEELKETALALWILDSNKTNPTLEEILSYAKTDLFSDAKKIIFDELKKKNLTKIFDDIEKPLIPIIENMMKVGIKIDKKYLSEISKEYHKKLEILEKEIWKIAGEEFNIASPKQLSVILFDKMGLTIKNHKKTGSGAKSTKESELEKMKDLSPIIPKILEHRELSKLLGTYIDTIPTMLDNNDRLHTTLLQAGTTTGRMASQDPNIQNIPIRTELGRNIRKGFIAEKGFSLVSFDYSQIELRVAAFLSGDEKLLDIFKKGEDVHSSVASKVFKVSLEKVDKEMRRKAKVINFGIIFGMGVNALRVQLGGDRKEAQEFYNAYLETFSGLTDYLNKTKASVYRLGYSETFFGRRRYFEGIKSKLPFIRASAERMAINAPIQGTEADIIKIAMTKIDKYLSQEGLKDEARLLLQVHDELLFEIKDDLLKKVSPEIKKIMESVLDPKDIKGVKCEAGISVGENWAEMTDLKK